MAKIAIIDKMNKTHSNFIGSEVQNNLPPITKADTHTLSSN